MKKFFIFGVPRSGTTWVFKYIFAHYNVKTFSSEEVGFFTKFFGRFGNLQKLNNRTRLFEAYKSRFIRKIIHNDVTNVPTSVTYFDYFDDLIEQIKSDANYFVDKTPLNILVADLLLTRYNADAQSLIVVRNPLDQATSMTYGSVKLGKWMRILLPFEASRVSYAFELWKKAMLISKNNGIRIFLFEKILIDTNELDEFLQSIDLQMKQVPTYHENHLKVNSSFSRQSGERGTPNIIERYPTLTKMVDEELLLYARQLGYQMPVVVKYWPRAFIRMYSRSVLAMRIASMRLYFAIHS